MAPNLDTSIWREDEGLSVQVPQFFERLRGPEKERTEFTMEEVSKHNTEESCWVVIEGKVYDATAFVDRHPGGRLTILHMAGKDATDAFAGFHPARIYKTLLPSMYKGEVKDYAETEVQRVFRGIRQQLLREGKFETDPSFYRKLYAWYASLFGASVYLTLCCGGLAAHMAGAAFMALFWQQIAFLGHDAGHNGVSHKRETDSLCGLVAGNLLSGISGNWWKHSHNVHHTVCNSIEHDPDIQHMPIFAVHEAIVTERFWSTYHLREVNGEAVERLLASWLIPVQHYLFYPVMGLARFNLYAQSYIRLFSKDRVPRRAAEFATLLGFAAWHTALVLAMPAAGAWERALYVAVSHVLAGVLHVQICLSHFAMHTYHGRAYTGAEDDWYHLQVSTTLDIDCPEYLDWFHGGLQFQVEHHLFPRLPRHNLRYCQKLVKRACRDLGMHFNERPWIQAQRELLASMRTAALKARRSGRVCGTDAPIIDGLFARG